MPLVKICGITGCEELDWVIDAGADYAGIVMYFPKSKRNISLEAAGEIIRHGAGRIKMVAVTVSPSLEQIKELERVGFDIVQIHGRVEDDIINSCMLPVLKAFNIRDLHDCKSYNDNSHVIGYVFDAQLPGSGKGFEWSLLNDVPTGDKLTFLAGGLDCDNVVRAAGYPGISGVDTSTGVENDNGIGKNKDKIYEFVRLAKEGYRES